MRLISTHRARARARWPSWSSCSRTPWSCRRSSTHGIEQLERDRSGPFRAPAAPSEFCVVGDLAASTSAIRLPDVVGQRRVVADVADLGRSGPRRPRSPRSRRCRSPPGTGSTPTELAAAPGSRPACRRSARSSSRTGGLHDGNARRRAVRAVRRTCTRCRPAPARRASGVAPLGRGKPDDVAPARGTARAGWRRRSASTRSTPLASTFGPASACGLNASCPPAESVVLVGERAACAGGAGRGLDAQLRAVEPLPGDQGLAACCRSRSSGLVASKPGSEIVTGAREASRRRAGRPPGCGCSCRRSATTSTIAFPEWSTATSGLRRALARDRRS